MFATPKHLLPVYQRSTIEVARGEGVYLYDTAGRQYLDFASGIAVNSVGHCHPHVVQALVQQAGQLWHSSNLYRIPGQERLAERLCDLSGLDVAFFCNSGVEAVEAAIKMLRRHFYSKGSKRYRIITMREGFHGRSMAAISATQRPGICEGFGPLLEGFDPVPYNDVAALEAAIGDETAAIMLEPILGEGGVHVATDAYLQAIRRLCDQHGLLMVCDEVQCGVSRTGRFFAYEYAGIKPDIITMAKGIGGGFPLGVCLSTRDAAVGMTRGKHGGTYGGNPLAMAVGNAVLDIVSHADFLAHVLEMGKELRVALQELVAAHPAILRGLRGKGLMLGVQTVIENTAVVESWRSRGLLSVPAAENIIRLVPPLVLEPVHIQQAVEMIEQSCQELERDVA